MLSISQGYPQQTEHCTGYLISPSIPDEIFGMILPISQRWNAESQTEDLFRKLFEKQALSLEPLEQNAGGWGWAEVKGWVQEPRISLHMKGWEQCGPRKEQEGSSPLLPCTVTFNFPPVSGGYRSKSICKWGIETQACNPSVWMAEMGEGFLVFKASLSYRIPPHTHIYTHQQ